MKSRVPGCLVATVGMAVLLFVGFYYHGRWLPELARALDVRSELQPSDVIVVLGGGSGDRPRYAGSLFKQGLATHVIATGAPIGSDQGATELETVGVPRDAIVLANGTRNTRDDALQTMQLMQQHGWRTALLVTDPYHVRRSLWTFRSAFGDSSLRVWPAPVIGGTFDADHWWQTEDGFVEVEEEYVKLGYYIARGFILPSAITVR